MSRFKRDWATFKNDLTNFGLDLWYLEEGSLYDIWINVNGREFYAIVKKTTPVNADQIDFETNYKPNANKIGTDALRIQPGVLFRPRVFANTADISVSANSAVTLFDSTAQSIAKGRIDFLTARTNDDQFEIELIIDGIQIYRLKLRDLKYDYKLRSDNDGFKLPIGVGEDRKQFFDCYQLPADFDSSLIVQAHNTRSYTKKVYSYLIRLREKI